MLEKHGTRHHDARPLTVDPDVSVTDAAHLMVDERIGALPVVEAGELIGSSPRAT